MSGGPDWLTEVKEPYAPPNTPATALGADLVLCRGDVVADIGRLCEPANIRAVIQGGRIVHAG